MSLTSGVALTYYGVAIANWGVAISAPKTNRIYVRRRRRRPPPVLLLLLLLLTVSPLLLLTSYNFFLNVTMIKRHENLKCLRCFDMQREGGGEREGGGGGRHCFVRSESIHPYLLLFFLYIDSMISLLKKTTQSLEMQGTQHIKKGKR